PEDGARQGGRVPAREQRGHARGRAAALHGTAHEVHVRVRPQAVDRQALRADGRGGNTVLRHSGWNDAAGSNGDRPRPRFAAAGARVNGPPQNLPRRTPRDVTPMRAPVRTDSVAAAICLGLFAVTAGLYARSITFDYVNY